MWLWLGGLFVFAAGAVLVGYGMARPDRRAGALGIAFVVAGLACWLIDWL